MKLYAGVDLHSNNNYICIINNKEERIFKKKLPNDIDEIVTTLIPYQKELEGIAVESTFNWY